MKLKIEKYWGTRYYALIDEEGGKDELLALFAYRIGAETIKAKLEDMDRQLKEFFDQSRRK